MELLYASCKDGNLNNLKLICDKLKTIRRNSNSNSGASFKNSGISTDFLYKADEKGLYALDLTIINNNIECCKYLFETFNLNPLDLNVNGLSALAYSIGILNFIFK